MTSRNIDYYVIHCDKHTDRLDHIENHMKKNIPKLKVWNGTIIESFEENIEEQFKKYSQDLNYTGEYAFHTPGEIGCYVSHHLLLKHLMKNNQDDGFTVVFEDDVTLCNDFKNKLENILFDINVEFDILFLSLSSCNRRQTQEMRNNKITEFNSLVKNKFVQGEGCYAMVYSNKSLKKLYDISCNVIHAIDVMYVSNIKNKNIISYVCTPYICLHSGEFSTTIHKGNNYVKQKLSVNDKSLFS